MWEAQCPCGLQTNSGWKPAWDMRVGYMRAGHGRISILILGLAESRQVAAKEKLINAAAMPAPSGKHFQL